jgi:menaquinone-9 beta-reductase
MDVLPALEKRNRVPELMDEPDIAHAEHVQALTALARINWCSGSAAIVWPRIADAARTLRRPMRILDVATGGGDVPVRLWHKARRAGLDVGVSACDVSIQALAFAESRAARAGAEMRFFQWDILHGPPPGQYDVVVSSLFLHHLAEDQAEMALRNLASAASHSLLINDLRRSRLGWLTAQLFCRMLSTSHVVHFDGPASVAGASRLARGDAKALFPVPLPARVAALLSQRCDALLIGGGPAGASSALLLARAGWSVVLCERKSFPRRKVCGEYLSATNLPLFDGLGIGDEFRDRAGPAVKRVGVFAGSRMLVAELPRAGGDWGRAWGREHLDTLLLDRARGAGTEVLQPSQVTALRRDGENWLADVQCMQTRQMRAIEAGVVIAAHGSWDVGEPPTQPTRFAPRRGDLLGFKAHFERSDLEPELMPLLAFPGGYGGMVHCEGNRVSLSCCVRRDCLSSLRGQAAKSAGEAVEDYVRERCAGVEKVLANARRLGPWLAAGPIRPGIRLRYRNGLFAVGNSAGEAHPVVAEGISMALQSAWLLTTRLQAWRSAGGRASELEVLHRDYARSWRRAFRPRLRAAALLAHWAMRPGIVASTLPLLRWFPQAMTLAARWSGKATQVV